MTDPSPYELLLDYTEEDLRTEWALKSAIETRAVGLITAAVATTSLLLVLRQVGTPTGRPIPLGAVEVLAAIVVGAAIALALLAAIPRNADATSVAEIRKLAERTDLTRDTMLGYALRGRVEDLSSMLDLNRAKARMLWISYIAYGAGSVLWLLATLIRIG